MKYMIMECHTSYAVLLDENGCFWKAANRRYQIGQTVEDPVLMREAGAGKRMKLRAVMAAAVAAACFLLAFTGYYRDYMVMETAVYLTINPSVRMELNRKGQVMNVSGINEDGRKLLEGYRQGSRERLTVAKELIGRAAQMGYLSAGGTVVVDIDAPEEAVFQKYGVELRTELADYLRETLEVEIQIVKHDGGAGNVPAKPEEEDPSVTETEPGKAKQPAARPADCEEPVYDKDSGCAAPAGNGSDTDDGGGSGHEDHSGDGGGSRYGEDSGYGSGSDYKEDSGYGSSLGHEGESDYNGGSGHGEDSDYSGGSGHSEDSDYSGGSGHSEDSDYAGGSDYKGRASHGSSDYEGDSGH